MPSPPALPSLDLSGKWILVKMPDMPDDYLELTPDPHFQLERTTATTFRGSYHFGAQDGEIEGRVEKSEAESADLFFTFEGEDEGDPTSGAAVGVRFDVKLQRITGVLRYHNGDDLEFVLRRAVPRAVAVKKAAAKKKAAKKKPASRKKGWYPKNP